MFYLLRELKHYKRPVYRSSFSMGYLVTVALMMALIVILHYYPLRGYKLQLSGATLPFVASYLLYLVPFATAFLVQFFFYKNALHLKSRWLWLVIILSPAVFSFRINFNFYGFLIDVLVPGKDQQYWYYIFYLMN